MDLKRKQAPKRRQSPNDDRAPDTLIRAQRRAAFPGENHRR